MKTTTRNLALVWAILVPTLAWADDGAAIGERNAAFEAAFNGGDAAGVAALYSADAVLMPPDMAMVNGREGAEALWAGFIEAGATDLDLTTVTLDLAGDMANEIGTFTLSVPDGNGGMQSVAGKYIVIWKRDEAGAWNLHWDIWNADPAG
ncbi:DUF4440 domain-containing protein [Defluviimonas sp. D31]|uniref:DUF4440 domain-containing protein n=2 Tax=Albidovulum TaxID=205889 RepID=A0ABT3IZB1_9RHOB|nr:MULTISPECIES: DUF4440 domain-containing protein [Defluviimonas]MCU9848496.1 DUF4440 domain-containing protein [Defluviimonas sp. WL0024]MCW3780520.1 DUF4440 domain-containing protein [Defluviimonas salinarum]MDW4550240.1 DUF4440 domain-containing protein [Defluviimonas sp. D31]